MRHRRAPIPQRRRVYLGCEGESEQSYGVLLGRFADARQLALHIDADTLQPGAGDPLGLIERAVQRAHDRSERGGRYVVRAVLLDADKLGLVPERDGRAMTLAARHGFHLIWQSPCHEAFLLRHLERCQMLRPATTDQALRDLCGRWPDYRKKLPANRLALKLDEACILRAAAVEDGLRSFLDSIAFPRP